MHCHVAWHGMLAGYNVLSCGVRVCVRAAPKSVVARMRKWKKVLQFHVKQYPRGHNLTKYSTWATATEQYDTEFEADSEPYFIAHWEHMPWWVGGQGRRGAVDGEGR